KFNSPITMSHTPDPKPHPYKPDLTPLPSILRPHCLARQRLLMWQPASAPPRSAQSNNDKSLLEREIERILTVIGASWSESTKELYGTGLLIFHVYCDINNIPDHLRAPVSTNTFAAFLSSCAGAYSGSTIANYAAAIKAWHLLHGMEWTVKDAEYKALLEGATRLAPSSSKRPKRVPFTVDILERFSLLMNLDDPCDAAIFACLTCSFFCITRLGEFTVPAISKFDPSKHITRAGFTLTQNHEGLTVMRFSLPSTKTSKEGEEVHCTLHNQNSRLDPKGALDRHLRINPDRESAHLFAWKHPSGGLRPLSKKEVTKRIDAIVKGQSGLPDLKGHSLHIGGTLFYLLKGVPFNIVKTMGRWSSELFTLYLWHHTIILAPFLQQHPHILDNLRRYILPP
ncbi:hypothetical protein BDN67DRAFT_879765, partial [Paxillus ammoniavirescens]